MSSPLFNSLNMYKYLVGIRIQDDMCTAIMIAKFWHGVLLSFGFECLSVQGKQWNEQRK